MRNMDFLFGAKTRVQPFWKKGALIDGTRIKAELEDFATSKKT